MAVLALDIGSSELKAAVYGQMGECLGTSSVEYRHSPAQAQRSELSTEELWNSVKSAVASVVPLAGKDRVRAAAIASHGESFIPLDKNGSPLGAFLLNLDSRAGAEMEELVGAFGAQRLYETTGLPPHPMYTLPKIVWLRKHASFLFERAEKFLCIEDYLLHRAGVGDWIGSSLAARTLALDLASTRWSEPLLANAGISEASLSRVVPAGRLLGPGHGSAMRELNLPDDVLWVSGGHDQSCCALGAGGLGTGSAVDGTGTFECLSVPLDGPLTSPLTRKANLPCGLHVAPRKFLTLAYTPGGVVLQWFRRQFGRDTAALASELKRNVYDLLLQGIPEEPTGIFVFPHLFGTGTPWLDLNARGAIVGLTSETTREAVLKAMLEGVTFEMRWNLEVLETVGIPIERLLAVGGGARSAAWLQLKADIFGREVLVVPGEATSRGAAICAALGSGLYQSDKEAVASMVKTGRSYEPRPQAEARYRELFQQYKEIARKLYGFELVGPPKQPVLSGVEDA